eukprot:TRINITY_DN7604_c0_g1_i3.p1 TRINITY_DN7604_c0_g1~~TRINITY_DN7604_c0_g1_i3.p1  ORF type:complete len:250 (+),score=36.38 TRINITY_DN7604_c0_g1_i3:605-1354(+)
MDFKFRKLELGTRVIQLQIWDKDGRDRFRTVGSCYYRCAHAIIVCYEVTDLASWRNVRQWLQEVDRYACESVIRMVVGMKCELEYKRVVSFEEAKEYAEEVGVHLIETSSKMAVNVDAVFRVATCKIMQRMFSYEEEGVVAIPYGHTQWRLNAHGRCSKVVQERVFAVVCAWRWQRTNTRRVQSGLAALPVEVLVLILEQVDHKDTHAGYEFDPVWDALQPQVPNSTPTVHPLKIDAVKMGRSRNCLLC